MQLEHFDSLPSTNDYLLEKSYQDEQWHVCWADSQTAGKGQKGRVWQSPAGVNLYISFSRYVTASANQLMTLPMQVGELVQACLAQFEITSTLKHPNDILVNGKKIAGVLVESKLQKPHALVVIGIGLNVNLTADPGIDQAWTSMRLEAGKEFELEEVARVMIEEVTRKCV